MIQNLFQRLITINPELFQLKYTDQTILVAFEHLLNIDKHIQMQEEQKFYNRMKSSQKQVAELRKLFLEPGKRICEFCGYKDISLTYSLPLMHLIYMPQQERFIKSLGSVFPQASRERLLLSDQRLPVFLRLLIPEIETREQFLVLQQDEEWLNQKVYLSKPCYLKLSTALVGYAKQSERLEDIQDQFSQQMLAIMKKKAIPVASRSTLSPLQRSKTMVSSPRDGKNTLALEARQARKEPRKTLALTSRSMQSLTLVREQKSGERQRQRGLQAPSVSKREVAQ